MMKDSRGAVILIPQSREKDLPCHKPII